MQALCLRCLLEAAYVLECLAAGLLLQSFFTYFIKHVKVLFQCSVAS